MTRVIITDPGCPLCHGRGIFYTGGLAFRVTACPCARYVGVPSDGRTAKHQAALEGLTDKGASGVPRDGNAG